MKKRENEALETYRHLHESRLQLAREEMRKIDESAEARQSFINNYYSIREKQGKREALRTNLMEAARNDALATVVKAIYITALEAECLMDENIALAENMVDKWIEEAGGASNILGKVGNNTYLLSRITQIVEDAAEAEVKEIEAEEDSPEAEETVEDPNASKDVQIAKLSAQEAEIKAKIAALKADKKAEDEANAAEKEDAKDGAVSTDPTPATGEDAGDKTQDMDLDADDESETEEEEEESEDANADDKDAETEAPAEESEDDDDDIDLDAPIKLNDEDDEESEDEEEDDPELEKDEEELTDDEPDSDESAEDDDDVKDIAGEPIDPEATEKDEEEQSHGKIFDELEKEEDVQKAVELIRSRVADAEESFIKANAEDKKKIDDLLNKISNNVKTVETLSEKDPKKAEIAAESAREYRAKMNEVHKNRPYTVFGKMASLLTESILKNDAVSERYLTEDGNLDVDLAVESARVMYGFLETVNTLQLEKVDEKYIANVLNNMR